MRISTYEAIATAFRLSIVLSKSLIRISMDNELSVYSIEDELIAQHRLQQGAERWHTIAEHHQALWNAPELAVQTRDLRRYEEAASCN